MAEWGNEVEAAVNSVVNDVPAVQTALVVEVALKLVVDVADDGVETGEGKLIPFSDTQRASWQENCILVNLSQRKRELLNIT